FTLSPDSPSAYPQPTICAVGSPWVCQFPLWLEDPSSPPPAFNGSAPAPGSLVSTVGPPAPLGSLVSTVARRPTSSTGLPCLHRHPSAHQLHWAPSGSLIPPTPPWSVDSTPPVGPRRSVTPAPLGSSLPPAPPQSSVTLGLLRTFGSPPWPPEPWTPPWPSGSLVSPGLVGFPPLAPPPLAPPQSFLHHGSSLRRLR
ncbi:hypothetical protein M9458_048502, partial [Cirrhinus mrigala]